MSASTSGNLLVGLTGMTLATVYGVFGVFARGRGARFRAPYAALGGAVAGAFVGAALFISSTSGGHFDRRAGEMVLGSALAGAFPGALAAAVAGGVVRRPWQAAALYVVLAALAGVPFLLFTVS